MTVPVTTAMDDDDGNSTKQQLLGGTFSAASLPPPLHLKRRRTTTDDCRKFAKTNGFFLGEGSAFSTIKSFSSLSILYGPGIQGQGR
mmetsp:Transcript_35046/g.55126  ORF Transcript_35046/g.55126 Transcript_35046/m.55126 type:complete len:87 (-) Transcript_35046:82-342(-)